MKGWPNHSKRLPKGKEKVGKRPSFSTDLFLTKKAFPVASRVAALMRLHASDLERRRTVDLTQRTTQTAFYLAQNVDFF